MTAKCGGGASALRPGVGGEVVFDAGLITEGLITITPWLAPFAALVDAFIFEALTQCTEDPPPMPAFGADDVTNLVGGVLNPNLHFTLEKIHNALLNYAWERFCVCTSGALVVTPPPAPPDGITQVSGNPNVPCFTGTWTGTAPNKPPGQSYYLSQNVTQALVPTTGRTRTQNDQFGNPVFEYEFASGVTSITAQSHAAQVSAAPSNTTGAWPVLFGYDTAGTIVLQQPLYQPPPSGIDSTITFTVPSTMTWVAAFAISSQIGTDPPVDIPGTTSTRVWCGGGGPTGIESCCPPDPSISIGIRNILQLLSNIKLTLPPAATSWTDGVRHSSLRDHGSFTIDPSALAIRVEVRIPPSHPHILPGFPDFYWDMGFITPLALGSPLRGWRIVFLSETFTLPEFTDQIGYTLLDGTVIDAIELLPVYAPATP